MPYVTSGATDCVTAGSDYTRLPSKPAIPTNRPTSTDLKDPLGWTYCFDAGFWAAIDDPTWYSQFSDDIVGVLSNESVCIQVRPAVAPASPVSQASFLLETTTSFITAAEETSNSVLETSTSTPPTSSVVVGPFEASAAPSTTADSKSTESPSAVASKPDSHSSTPVSSEPSDLHKGDVLETDETTVVGQAMSTAIGSVTFSVSETPTYPTYAAHSAETVEPFLVFGGKTATLVSASEYRVGTQTLKSGGPAITLSGSQVSLGPDADAVVVESSTSNLEAVSVTGGYVWAGIAGVLPSGKDSMDPRPSLTEGPPDKSADDTGISSVGIAVDSTVDAGDTVTESVSAEKPVTPSQTTTSSTSAATPVANGANTQHITQSEVFNISSSTVEVELSSSSTPSDVTGSSPRMNAGAVAVGLAMACVWSLFVMCPL